MPSPKASIIIPTFNRAGLISETLDSILSQTYVHWECLVIDDGSTDTTDALLLDYCNRDNRFRYFKRPENKPKGANACRNIGLAEATGDYIIFFDSDDLMTPDHVAVKINGVQKSDFDFVITRTQFFNAPNTEIDKYYTFTDSDITAENYITQTINWLTLDVCIKAEIAKCIRFNEQLQSGQEYNYFSKLTVKTTEAKFIDKVVSLRRYDEASTQGSLKNTNKKIRSSFLTHWATYNDLKAQLDTSTKKKLLLTCINQVYECKGVPNGHELKLTKSIFSVFGLKGFNFVIMLFLRKFFNKGYQFRKRMEV